MRIHHLNCGTMCPLAGRLVGGPSWFRRGLLVCHCLLIETDRDGLVLVETGFGAALSADRTLVPKIFPALLGTPLDPAESAVAQVKARGLNPADVRHIVVTHLDFDHAGGIADFPRAQIHVHRREYETAMRRPTARDRVRYMQSLWDRGPRWNTYDELEGGDVWKGLPAVRNLRGIRAEIALVPLPGHSAGHSGVAVRDGAGWLLHAGDAYFYHGELATPPSCPPALRLMQAIDGHDRRARLTSAERLRELALEDDVTIFCAHDPVELEAVAEAVPVNQRAGGKQAGRQPGQSRSAG